MPAYPASADVQDERNRGSEGIEQRTRLAHPASDPQPTSFGPRDDRVLLWISISRRASRLEIEASATRHPQRPVGGSTVT
jgi:hypothetical protein